MFNKLCYANHSGFILEAEKTVLVFDFYTDPAQVLSQYEYCGKTVCFFVSHNHADHWNPDIFLFRNNVPSYYFLDASLEKEGRALCEATAFCESKTCVQFVSEKTLLTEDHLIGKGIQALVCAPSTDEGVAFWVQVEDQSVFHAGDLNNWDWSDRQGPLVEARYREILKDLKRRGSEIGLREPSVAFVPVDQRLQSKALSGARIFCEMFSPRYLVPMHLNGGNDLPMQLRSWIETKEGQGNIQTNVLDFSKNGECFSLTFLS